MTGSVPPNKTEAVDLDTTGHHKQSLFEPLLLHLPCDGGGGFQGGRGKSMDTVFKSKYLFSVYSMQHCVACWRDRFLDSHNVRSPLTSYLES